MVPGQNGLTGDVSVRFRPLVSESQGLQASVEICDPFFFVLRRKGKHAATISMHHQGESDISSLTAGLPDQIGGMFERPAEMFRHGWTQALIGKNLSPTFQEEAVRLDSTESSHQGK
jgi:hypothetical protein